MKRHNCNIGIFLVALIALLLPVMAQAQVGYIDATSGFMKEQTFLTSQAVTASSASTIVDVGAYEGGVLTVNVTAVTGTNPTLDVALQTCTANSAATCTNLQSITQMTATGMQLLQANGFGRWIRLTWTLGGTTPNFTMSIYGAFKPYYWQAQTGFGDPCESAGVPKSSVPIAISSATTAALVPIVGSKAIYVCAFTLTYTSGTSPTVQFKYGTQTTTACDTGAANLSGVMAVQATSGTATIIGAGHTVFTTPAANQLCVTSGGTTPNLNGFLTYVQQ